MMDLNALRSAIAIMEHGGIAEAHRATGVPRSTLSRHLAEAEQHLGVRLVERSSRRFRVTEEGQAAVLLAGEHLRGLADLAERMGSRHAVLAGSLRISVPVLFGQSLLGRVAVSFAASHPGVFLDLVVEDRHVDPLAEGYDAVLRVNPSVDSMLNGRLLGSDRLVLTATPGLAARVGYRDGHPEEVEWPALVRPGWGDGGSWDVEAGGRRVTVAARARMAVSSPVALLVAVQADLGAALLPRSLVQAHLSSGTLLDLGTRSGPPEEVWILHSAGRLPSRRLLAFMDVLSATFRDRAAGGAAAA